MNLGIQELVILSVLGVLLFGKKLPEVGRYLGKSITEFKKGMKGLEDEFSESATSPMRESSPAPAPYVPPRPPQRVKPTAPKFEEHLGAISPPPQS